MWILLSSLITNLARTAFKPIFRQPPMHNQDHHEDSMAEFAMHTFTDLTNRQWVFAIVVCSGRALFHASMIFKGIVQSCKQLVIGLSASYWLLNLN